MRKYLVLLLLLGVVSLLADVTYEGGASILGSYMAVLGATAVTAGLLGIPEFLSYVSRLVSGVIASRRPSLRVYWSLIFLGYALNLAIPLIALTGRPEEVIALVFLERFGKGLRAPVRDAIIADITEGIGRGKGFGIHELLDQVGAVVGPASVAYALYTSGSNYRYAYSLLLLPVLASLAVLAVAAGLHRGRAPTAAPEGSKEGRGGLGRELKLFILASSLTLAGFLQWRSIVSYHLKVSGLVDDYLIATMYSVAMAVDAAIALPAGVLYDRLGLKVTLVAPLTAATVAPLLLSNSVPAFITAGIMWGVFMGVYETLMRAAIADLSEPRTRPYAYGIHALATGISWAVGTLIIATLYEVVTWAVIPFTVACQVVSAYMITSKIPGRRNN